MVLLTAIITAYYHFTLLIVYLYIITSKRMTSKYDNLGPSLPPYICNVAEQTDKISLL